MDDDVSWNSIAAAQEKEEEEEDEGDMPVVSGELHQTKPLLLTVRFARQTLPRPSFGKSCGRDG